MSINRDRLSKRIAAWVEEHRDEAVRLVSELVRIESVNRPPIGGEAACQSFVADWMRQAGAEVTVYEMEEVPDLERHPAYRKGRRYVQRPNVSGIFRGGGTGRSLMFSGHIDTVGEGGTSWKYPPFAADVEDGKLYGRGALDMKGGLAAAFMAIACLRSLGVALVGDVLVESVVDEEYGGANGTLAARLRRPHADMAIIPEPSHLKLYSGHLGGGMWRAGFTGKGGVDFSGEQLISALDATVDFARLLREYGAFRKRRFPAPALWRSGREAEVESVGIVSGDPHMELPDKTPDMGELTFWIDGYPGMTGDGIIQDLWDYYETRLDDFPLLRVCRPVIVPLMPYLEASVMPGGTASETFLRHVAETGARVLGKPCAEPSGAPFACDGFMFNLYSPTPALILGPGGGNAHAPNEFLDLSSYYTLIQWFAEIAADWCGWRHAEMHSGGTTP